MIATASATSNLFNVLIQDSSSTLGAGLTGLTNTSAGLIISTICDNEASPVSYTATGSTIQDITTIGTYSAPSASNCRFKQVSSGFNPGMYQLQLADARFAVASAKRLYVSISGATNAVPCHLEIDLTKIDLQDNVRGGMTAFPNVNSGSAGALLVDGTGTASISNSAGIVKANVTQFVANTISFSGGTMTWPFAWLVAPTTAGATAVRFTGAASSGVGDSGHGLSLTGGVSGAADALAGHGLLSTGGADTNSGVAGDGIKGKAGALTTGTAGKDIRGDWAGNQTGSITGSVASVTGNVAGNVTGSVGSVVGAVGSVTGAVGSVTGNIGGNVVGSVASVAGNVSGSVASVVGAVGSVAGAVGSVTGNVGGNVTGSVGSVAGNVSGSVASVVGAVGSVTGNVGGNVVGSVGTVTTISSPQNLNITGTWTGNQVGTVTAVGTLLANNDKAGYTATVTGGTVATVTNPVTTNGGFITTASNVANGVTIASNQTIAAIGSTVTATAVGGFVATASNVANGVTIAANQTVASTGVAVALGTNAVNGSSFNQTFSLTQTNLTNAPSGSVVGGDAQQSTLLATKALVAQVLTVAQSESGRT